MALKLGLVEIGCCCSSSALALVVLSATGLAPQSGLAAPAPIATAACGPVAHSTAVDEPQSVDMWEAPVDASGDHELILAVHTDEGGNRFCYVYRWQGAVHYVAPAIHVRRGERFAVRIVNDISGPSPGEDVPSASIPACQPMSMAPAPAQHWTGYLNHVIDDRYFAPKPIDTNLHLHGFEGPASEENVLLSTLSTPMHACEYVISIPHTQPPGTYIFHPHAHGAADTELGNGLVGVWIVDPDTPQIASADQHVLLLTYRTGQPTDRPNPPAAKYDELFSAIAAHDAAIKPAPPVPYDPFNPPAWPSAIPQRLGNVLLASQCSGGPFFPESLISVDGANAPAALKIPAGRTQLLRIVNGTADSPKLLRLRDAQGRALPFAVVERDGVPVSGDMQHPYAYHVSMQELMLSPMSRAAILLTAPAGASFVLSSEPWCSGFAVELHHDLLRVAAVAGRGVEAHALDSAPISASDTPAAKLVAWVHAHPSDVHRRAITFSEYSFPKRGKIPRHFAYYITDTTHPDFHEHPFWPVFAPGATVPSNPDVVVKQGTIEVWYLINTTLETHDFHIHQMKFVQERDYSGIPVTVDTVFQPLGKLLPNPKDPDYPLIQPSITKVILDFRHVPKGTFVFHCHMLGH
ncbi:MAG: multicopper oxidase domain-containing protein, partial [Proteobacteria bacterium]|nr:multicopper oxidase domain-containing protein [Pseudomonadota bacterium]